MTAETIIAQIQGLPPDEIKKIADFLGVRELEGDHEADRLCAERDRELEEGKVAPLTNEEAIFARVRASL